MRRWMVAIVALAFSLGSGATLAADEPEPTTGAFAPAGSLAEARWFHTATLLPDGRVLVVGGASGDFDPLASVEVWDPATGTYTPSGSLGEARMDHEATLLTDGRVLVVGGGGVGEGTSAEVWDPATGEFAPAGSLAKARPMHTATLLPDGRVLVVGGSGDDRRALATAKVWDPVTASFGPAGSLTEARYQHTATLLTDGRVLVVGGWGDDDALASAEVWDPATGTFSPAGSLAEARWHHTATPLPDGRVLVVGGSASLGTGSEVALAEAWDPATASFSPAGSLAEARSGHTATLLPDGRVLVVGGGDADVDDYIAAAEVWDPATASFSPSGLLAEARERHTATLLTDGRVLVVGGTNRDYDLLASTEVWDPTISRSVPEATDQPKARADPALEAQFPDSVSGEPLAVEWLSGRAFVDGLPEGVAALAEGLVAAQGKTLDDVTIASASSTLGSIVAVRLAEGDAMAFLGSLLADWITRDPNAEWTSIQVAGKDVMTPSFAPGKIYLYPQGEVVWWVDAEEPALTEIFTALP